MPGCCMLDQITPVILTCNEEANIDRALERLSWAERIVVVDSYSVDSTLDIASSFSGVEIFQRPFTSHAEQWNFAIEETSIQTRWILALDADYVLTSQLITELRQLEPEPGIAGYSVSFQYCIFGSPLRGTLYPPVTVLFQRQGASYYQDGHTQRIRVAGKTAALAGTMYHDDRKPLAAWLMAQDRYMSLEAESLADRSLSALPFADQVRRKIVVAPLLVFLYCLLVKRCILDGWPGLYYALQRSVAEIILSLKLIELRIKKR